MDLKEFGKFFSQHRLASGFSSQRKLAEAADVSNGTIARIEDGSQQPSPDTLRKLSRYLKTTNYKELMELAGYGGFEEMVYDSNESNYGDTRGYYIKEAPNQYVTEKELDLLSRLKELAADLNLDLSDPGTFDTIKDAVNLIKRVRGE